MDNLKEEARQAYRDQQSQDTEGGCGEPVGFIAGYLTARRKAQEELTEWNRCHGAIILSMKNEREVIVKNMSEEIQKLDSEIQRRDKLLERAMYTINKYKDDTLSPNQWDLCESWLKDYEELKR